MILHARELDEPRFSAPQTDALFAAVLIDDEVDAHTELPDRISVDFDQHQLIDSFRICRQLWKDGVDRDELVELTRLLARDGDLGREDRLRFKYARAKFKHLRFAFALYDSSHRYPVLLNWVTTAMGHLQDAFKTGNLAAVKRQTALGLAFLSPVPQHLLRREIDRLSPTTPEAFRGYVLRQVATLRDTLARDTVTGAQFHATRKIVSRQVSFYDSLRTIEASPQAFMMSRSLSAINGLMGAMHDDLIEQKIAGTQDYHRERFALPADIRARLEALAARYPN